MVYTSGWINETHLLRFCARNCVSPRGDCTIRIVECPLPPPSVPCRLKALTPPWLRTPMPLYSPCQKLWCALVFRTRSARRNVSSSTPHASSSLHCFWSPSSSGCSPFFMQYRSGFSCIAADSNHVARKSINGCLGQAPSCLSSLL